ncbi:hypothetical protein C6495_02545 [Candidatus Poribacteria bacterium]|nr:MAG: hypothetical protein C6495_02545 [Candidatus Poribacteria bacterium]
MKKLLPALPLHDKIFFAYAMVFLLMFGLIFGITNFLIRLAFDRQIEAYVEELESEVSNNYTLLVAKMRKEVASIAEAPALHSAILKGQSDGIRYLRDTEFDVLEYGTAYGTLLASTWMEDPRIGTNVMRRSGAGSTRGTGIALRESGNGNIRLRKVEQNGGIEPRLVVEVTQAGDWGFLTGRRLLSKWMETETAIRSDEHAIFLVQENHSPIGEVSTTSGMETFAGDRPPRYVPGASAEIWIPLNNASRHALALREEWARRTAELPPEHERTGAHRKVDLQLEEANTERSWTGFRIEPLGSLFSDTLPVGIVVAYSHQRQREWQQQLTIILLLSGAGGLGLVYLISYVMSRRITSPIATLRAGVSEIAAGNLDHRVGVPSARELGQLAEGVNQMAHDLKQSLEERMAAERAATWRDVAQQVAHEVKNPLFPIRLSVENLQQAKASPEIFENIFQECTDTIIEEVDRIGRLIDEFQQFARMPKPKRELVDLNEIVTSVLTLYQGGSNGALRHGEGQPLPDVDALCKLVHPEVNIETEFQPLPKLSLDAEQIAQVLGNLVKNAIEAMPEGGTLRVQTSVTSNGTDAAPQQVALVVKDTGYGMSPETLENLFTPYYTTKTEGTGLGMAISQRIVADHGGEIDVKSDERVGTTVRIRFAVDFL